MEISVVLPAYNEEKNLTFAVESALKNLKKYFNNFEVIIIDDASSDSTLQIAQKLQKEHGLDLIKIHQNRQNCGQGHSLMTGIKMAKYKWITHNGVDCPFDFNDLGPTYKEEADSADMIVVTRQNRNAYGYWRKIVSRGFVSLINLFNNSNIEDYSFIQIFKKELCEKCLSPRYASTAFLMPSMILNAQKNGFKVISVSRPYHQRSHGKATGAGLRNICRGFKDLVSYRLFG